jgi:sugar transferase (PEP-CTERM/EpsH1 system associated)
MEQLLVQFARFTDRSRYDPTFVSLQSRGALAADIESHQSVVIAMNKSPGLKPSLVVQLAKTLRRIRPSVVHTHNTAGYIYGVAAAALARVPRVIHTRHGQRFDSSNRQTRVFRGLSRWVDYVVGVSSDSRQLTINEGIAESKAKLICNGIDLSRFKPVENRPQGRSVVVARLSPEKDVASLLHALRIARQQASGDAIPISLDVVGDGTERGRLESLATSLALGDAVRFHGMRRDIPELLSQASMFVLPSVTEGISLTLLEAMATGMPVVACRVGGNPEVVVEEQTGILVPPRDPRSLASAMLRIHQDSSLARRFGNAGRRRVEQNFCVRKMVRAYEALYEGKAA